MRDRLEESNHEVWILVLPKMASVRSFDMRLSLFSVLPVVLYSVERNRWYLTIEETFDHCNWEHEYRVE